MVFAEYYILFKESSDSVRELHRDMRFHHNADLQLLLRKVKWSLSSVIFVSHRKNIFGSYNRITEITRRAGG